MRIKAKKNCVIAVILKENKSNIWLEVPLRKERFSHANHTYFIESDGAYLNNKAKALILVYLEGVSVPIHHGYLEKETKKVKIMNNITRKEETHLVTKIKTLKFDSSLIDMLLNRHLADVFTKVHMDMPNLILAILLISSIIIGIINLVAQFYV